MAPAGLLRHRKKYRDRNSVIDYIAQARQNLRSRSSVPQGRCRSIVMISGTLDDNNCAEKLVL